MFPQGGARASSKPGNTLVAAYVTLTYAQCKQSAFAACLRSAQMADQIVTHDFAPVSLERAHTDMALAFAQWKNGDMETADRMYQNGLEMLKTVLGERHPVVITSMIGYRDFLKSNHQTAEAKLVSRKIDEAQAIRLKEMCSTCTVSVAALP